MSEFVRLNITTEGQAEEKFVREALAPHLGIYNISTDARSVLTSKDRRRYYRGGVISYQKAKNDIDRWLRSDKSDEARFTTMFDLYALPNDFPGYNDAKGVNDPYEKINILEQSFSEDIGDQRFIPYIQLHEFETLLFSDLSMLEIEYFDHDKEISKLEKMLESFSNNPELINENVDTAPSKRIIKLIPEYKGNKVNVGATIASMIGIEHLKNTCRHFNEWVLKLEGLNRR